MYIYILIYTKIIKIGLLNKNLNSFHPLCTNMHNSKERNASSIPHQKQGRGIELHVGARKTKARDDIKWSAALKMIARFLSAI
jgi:hypothetical protein